MLGYQILLSTSTKYLAKHIDFCVALHHNLPMKHKAQISALTPIGAVITTAEAVVTCKLIIRLQAVDLKEIHSDLPQLQDRYGKGWTRP